MPCPQPKTGGALGSSIRESEVHACVFSLSDQVEYLAMTHRAFEAVERLTSCETRDAHIEVSRDELAALFLVLNRAMRSDIEKTMEHAKACLSLTRVP